MKRAALPVAALLSTLAGCAALPPLGDSLPPGAPDSLELAATPFFAQEAYQCGPAALAMMLSASGVDTTPEALIADVFLPGRQGSLQLDMLGATRRHDRLAYVLPGRVDALIAELSEGRPVLVLQNLGVESYPVWHYAVLVGYDASRGVAVLRSGRDERLETRWRRFVTSWQRGGRWAFTVLDPGAVPAAAEPEPYLEAAAGLEAAGRWRAAARAYEAALGRWPEEPLAWFGAGNAAYAAGRLAAATDAYARGAALAPDIAAIRNNLAQALLDAGCAEQAAPEAQAAVRLARGTSLESIAAETLAGVQHALAAGSAAGRCKAGLANGGL